SAPVAPVAQGACQDAPPARIEDDAGEEALREALVGVRPRFAPVAAPEHACPIGAQEEAATALPGQDRDRVHDQVLARHEAPGRHVVLALEEALGGTGV